MSRVPKPVMSPRTRNLDLLDAPTIWRTLTVDARRSISGIEIFDEIDSTNAYLLRKRASGNCAGRVCLAETQTAGRGRYGKTWVSPHGANLYMSLACRLDQPSAAVTRLSLVIGVALADALTALGIDDLGLKWPNDILWQGKKLGGVLIEAADGFVVIGIGLNVRMPPSSAAKIDQPWIDLAAVLQRDVPGRNWLAASMLNAIVPTIISSFERETRQSLSAAWHGYDLLYGRTVVLDSGSGRQRGTGLGVDDNGRLLLRIGNQELAFASGEARLRRDQGKPIESLKRGRTLQ